MARFKNNYKDKLLRFIHKSIYKPGHYYSSVPDPKEIESRESSIFSSSRVINGVNLNEDFQKDFLKINKNLVQDFPYLNESSSFIYKFPNNFFVIGDALLLYLVMRFFKPKKIIEIGSGFSSASMLDINKIFFSNSIDLTFIEPFPKRFKYLTSNVTAPYNLLEVPIQNTSINLFESLNENDILFIDSSHVSKIGSDLNHILFNVIPKLKKGVIIHFHDIFYPFEYPKSFIDYGIFWNEIYFLQTFLMYNDSFRVLLFNDLISKKLNPENILPEYANLGGASLWIQKMI